MGADAVAVAPDKNAIDYARKMWSNDKDLISYLENELANELVRRMEEREEAGAVLLCKTVMPEVVIEIIKRYV